MQTKVLVRLPTGWQLVKLYSRDDPKVAYAIDNGFVVRDSNGVAFGTTWRRMP
jgi:hypothetical protein